ncbi:MAG: hypothetical protein ACRD3M_14140 [Thermoanaerobaculia bacterium]
MADSVWAILASNFLTGLFTLVGVRLTQLHEAKKWKSEEERWYAEPYRQKRYEALADLHHSFTACLPSFLLQETPPDWRKHLHHLLATAHRAAVYAHVFIAGEVERKVLRDFLDAFREMSPLLLRILETPGQPPPELAGAYDEATRGVLACYSNADTLLRELLNPGPLARRRPERPG